MWVSERNFRNDSDDFKKMCGLIVDMNAEAGYDWSLGRIVDWKYGLWSDSKQEDGFFERNGSLWYTYLGELAGFCVSEDGDDEFQLVARPQYVFLYQMMIDELKRTSDSFSTVCSERDAPKLSALLQSGFSDEGVAETTYVYDAAGLRLVPGSLDAGYRILGMDEFADRASQTALRNNAFRRSREMSAGYVFASAYVKRSPLYDPYMDIVVVNGDGLAIAGCEGIIDYENGLVEIERVCTHDQYRKKGYATMAIHECIKRGIQRGVTKVQITGMNDVTRHMYSRFGESLVVKKHRFAYKK